MNIRQKRVVSTAVLHQPLRLLSPVPVNRPAVAHYRLRNLGSL